MAASLVLASASPQRKTLLAGLGLQFDVVPSAVDEEACAVADPAERSVVLAHLKAKDVAEKRPGSFVIGCDTLVVDAKNHRMEKPVDEADARRMLKLHSGTRSTVHSGLCVIDPFGNMEEGISSSHVWFKELSKEDMDWWISTGQWRDRSGGFQIDGQGQLMIERIDGDWTSIVGLPVFLLGQLLRRLKFEDF
jgi:septum formation protein